MVSVGISADVDNVDEWGVVGGVSLLSDWVINGLSISIRLATAPSMVNHDLL